MKKSLFILVLLVTSARADFQAWGTFAGEGKLAEDSSFSWFASSQIRLNLHQLLVQPGIRWQFSDSFGLGFGYGWAPILPASGASFIDEHRLFQDIYWKSSFGIPLSGRFRLEERISTAGGDTNWRMSEYIQLVISLGKESPWSLYIADEFFYNFNATDWGALHGMDQNRILLGLEYNSEKFQYRGGYMNVWLRANGQVNHALFFFLLWKCGDPEG